MKKTVKRIASGVIVLAFFLPLVFWGGALAKNLVLTAKHKEKIATMSFAEQQEPLPEFDWCRVTACSEEEMEIYFVNTLGKETDGEYKIGGTMVFWKTPSGWCHTKLVDSIRWSGAGSANQYVWPYWHHIFLV